MSTFFDSPYCIGGRNCTTCRDKSGGARFRRALVATYEDVEARDFDCPHGRKWGEIVRVRGLGDVIAKMTHAVGIPKCGGCGKRQAKMNKVLPF